MTPVASFLFYGLPGFALGVGVGWFVRQRRGSRTAPHDAPGAAVRRLPLTRLPVPRWARIPPWLPPAVGAVLIAIALTSSVLVFRQQAELSACLRRVYDTTTARLNAAGTIAAEDRKAVDDMVAGVLVPGKTPEQRGQVLKDYLAGRHARDKVRAKLQPYPATAGCDGGGQAVP